MFPPDPVDVRAFFIEHREEIEDLFVQEFIGQVPDSVKEPSMLFLTNARDVLEKWALYIAYAIQSNIISDPDKIQKRDGMLLMLRLILGHIKAKPKTKEELPPLPMPEKKDEAKAVENVVAELLLSRKDIV